MGSIPQFLNLKKPALRRLFFFADAGVQQFHPSS